MGGSIAAARIDRGCTPYFMPRARDSRGSVTTPMRGAGGSVGGPDCA